MKDPFWFLNYCYVLVNSLKIYLNKCTYQCVQKFEKYNQEREKTDRYC